MPRRSLAQRNTRQIQFETSAVNEELCPDVECFFLYATGEWGKPGQGWEPGSLPGIEKCTACLKIRPEHPVQLAISDGFQYSSNPNLRLPRTHMLCTSDCRRTDCAACSHAQQHACPIDRCDKATHALPTRED